MDGWVNEYLARAYRKNLYGGSCVKSAYLWKVAQLYKCNISYIYMNANNVNRELLHASVCKKQKSRFSLYRGI